MVELAPCYTHYSHFAVAMQVVAENPDWHMVARRSSYASATSVTNVIVLHTTELEEAVMRVLPAWCVSLFRLALLAFSSLHFDAEALMKFPFTSVS